MFCFKCGSNVETDKCEICSSYKYNIEAEEINYCPFCSKKIKFDGKMRFCINCGKNLKDHISSMKHLKEEASKNDRIKLTWNKLNKEIDEDLSRIVIKKKINSEAIFSEGLDIKEEISENQSKDITSDRDLNSNISSNSNNANKDQHIDSAFSKAKTINEYPNNDEEEYKAKKSDYTYEIESKNKIDKKENEYPDKDIVKPHTGNSEVVNTKSENEVYEATKITGVAKVTESTKSTQDSPSDLTRNSSDLSKTNTQIVLKKDFTNLEEEFFNEVKDLENGNEKQGLSEEETNAKQNESPLRKSDMKKLEKERRKREKAQKKMQKALNKDKKKAELATKIKDVSTAGVANASSEDKEFYDNYYETVRPIDYQKEINVGLDKKSIYLIIALVIFFITVVVSTVFILF